MTKYQVILLHQSGVEKVFEYDSSEKWLVDHLVECFKVCKTNTPIAWGDKDRNVYLDLTTFDTIEVIEFEDEVEVVAEALPVD